MNENSLTGKVAVITGSASGIGFETAKLFLSKGARVVLVDRGADKLEKAKKELASPHVMGSVCDVSIESDVIRTMDEAEKQFGRIDIIVNNAGVMIFKPLVEHTLEDWTKVLGVDLIGAFYFTKEGFRRMKNGGAIVNVSSIHAEETTPLVASYAAAKAAVLSLTRSSAIEGKEKKIRVNAILPGAIDTPMLWENPNIKAGLEVINQSDVGQAIDIAEAILFLSSPAAEFVQGAALRVDGGRLSRL
jgi:NAD(P)-dependent dehydrogenase (short-subunit alcohol dehydrogenase family)